MMVVPTRDWEWVRHSETSHPRRDAGRFCGEGVDRPGEDYESETILVYFPHSCHPL